MMSENPPRPDIAPDPGTAKAMGAFYTDAVVADFLVWWAVRRPSDRVMDPSFGGGVFLEAACRRVKALGGRPSRQVYGVELDPRVHGEVSAHLRAAWRVVPDHLTLSDFFAVDPGSKVEAVVGNPPFIRYQRFTGETRKRALRRAAEAGVQLTELTSSWAPFLVHSAAMLEPGGRLAMVTPVEIGHAAYALPVLRFFSSAFETVTFLTFRRKLFPELSEDTLLILAEGRGGVFRGFEWKEMPDSSALAAHIASGSLPLAGTRPVDAAGLSSGETRLLEYALPEEARALYHRLAGDPRVKRLGAIADVGIGYVTGANDYFHPDPSLIQQYHIPDRYLQRAVRRGRALPGLRFTVRDWEAAVPRGDAGHLLRIDEKDPDDPGLRAYLDHGVREGIPTGYKCRVRSPWFRVPHVYQADAFLTYMSGAVPRLIANEAGAVAPNTLHVLRIHPGERTSSLSLATRWYTSLTFLSTEIEGHALGGGMLKLEPTEAEQVLIALPGVAPEAEARAAMEIDEKLRAGDTTGAQAVADRLFLREGLELSDAECRLLATATDQLRRRRMFKEG